MARKASCPRACARTAVELRREIIRAPLLIQNLARRARTDGGNRSVQAHAEPTTWPSDLAGGRANVNTKVYLSVHRTTSSSLAPCLALSRGSAGTGHPRANRR